MKTKADYLIEITSSNSVQKAMQSCPRPIVYFPLLAPSKASNDSYMKYGYSSTDLGHDMHG